MTLNMQNIELKKTQLKEASEAYHNLISGQQPRVVVDQNGERVEFVAANQSKLYAYIQSLQAELGCAPVAMMSQPAQFFF